MALHDEVIEVPAKGGSPQFATRMTGSTQLHIGDLERDLRDAVEGDVRFDTASRALYATSATATPIRSARGSCRSSTPATTSWRSSRPSRSAAKRSIHELFRNEQQLGIHPDDLTLLPKGHAYVLVEFGGGSKQDSDDQAKRMMARLQKDHRAPIDMSLFDDEEQETRLWQVREAGPGATAFGVDGRDHWPVGRTPPSRPSACTSTCTTCARSSRSTDRCTTTASSRSLSAIYAAPSTCSATRCGAARRKATGGMQPELDLLDRMGLQTELLAGGCCGLAGSWGFEEGHHDISMRCAEEGILPGVRDVAPSTVVVADGFSCQTQLADADVGRRAVHVAQVIELARRGERLDGTTPPEARVSAPPRARSRA